MSLFHSPIATNLSVLAIISGLFFAAVVKSNADVREEGSFRVFEQRALAGERLSVVFLGGSLTWGANASDPQRTSYRALMGEWLKSKYPRAPISVHDAAIGGTGSLLGLFRLDRDVLSRNPDIVFLDFTVNDGLYESTPQQRATYEAILRELIRHGIPVCVITMGDKITSTPNFDVATLATYQAHLKLIAAYGTGHGDALMALRRTVQQYPQSLAQIYPFDGIHPDDFGYNIIFEAARDGYEQAIRENRVCRLPEKSIFDPACKQWKRIYLRDLPVPAGWEVVSTYRTSLWFDGLSSRWMGDVLACDVERATKIDPLRVEFTGTFVAIFGEADEKGLGFCVKIDGKPVLYHPKNSEPQEMWPFDSSRFGKGRLFQFQVLADELPAGRHVMEITPEISSAVKTGQLRIESVCTAAITRND